MHVFFVNKGFGLRVSTLMEPPLVSDRADRAYTEECALYPGPPV